jgi:hypothetical protein
MKREPHKNENKSLSIKNLLRITKESFSQIHSEKDPKEISTSDCLMSALAVFSLKSPSLLSFDKQRQEETVQHNLQTLFSIKNVPCDTYMREVLDEIDPQMIRKVFLDVFHELQRGKLLEEYRFLEDSYLCLVDGSGIFDSEKVHCQNCCCKHHKDGRTSYYHQILAAVIAKPGMSQVIPLCPEPITKQDGATKNDCERNAAHRLLPKIKQEHPRLKLTIVSDALSANAPQINEIKFLGYHFIIGIKPEGNKSIFSWSKDVTKTVKMTVGKNTYLFRYVNQIPLNDTDEAPLVNFLDCEAVEIDGRREFHRHFSWITDHKLDDKNLYTLMLGGRSRWKVENETFNTLKNQGYQFEHNFGHGKKNLHTVFAFLMMFAFLIDQVQEAACGIFREAIKRRGSRKAFWERMRSVFHLFFIKSWEDMFMALGPRFKGKFLDSS